MNLSLKNCRHIFDRLQCDTIFLLPFQRDRESLSLFPYCTYNPDYHSHSNLFEDQGPCQGSDRTFPFLDSFRTEPPGSKNQFGSILPLGLPIRTVYLLNVNGRHPITTVIIIQTIVNSYFFSFFTGYQKVSNLYMLIPTRADTSFYSLKSKQYRP